MKGSEEGFTYFGLLIIVAVMGMGLASFGELYSRSAQREKERELLFVGEQFRQAIALYYYRSPGAQQYPKSLEVLLEDNRFPMPVRYLRKLYRDPVTGKADWGIVEAPEGGIIGVYSKSADTPAKTANFPSRYKEFEEALRYSDWKFVFKPTSPPGPWANADKSPAR